METIRLSPEFIRKKVAFSDIIYQRGVGIYENGSYMCTEADPGKGWFVYDVDGNYGDYITKVQLLGEGVNSSCDCPYPGKGCKHTVAVLLDICERMEGKREEKRQEEKDRQEEAFPSADDGNPYLTPEEIRKQAIEDRKKRARHEEFKVSLGEMYKGEHLLETPKGKKYAVTFHDPETGAGHCSCPDFDTNRLDICKHMIFLGDHIRKRDDFENRIRIERFPFVDIYWDSAKGLPRMFCERPEKELEQIQGTLNEYFDHDGYFYRDRLEQFPTFLARLNGNKRVRVQEPVLRRLDDYLHENQLQELSETEFPSLGMIRTELYPYQKEGVKFGLFKRAVLIGDEMGLGKTIQAIALAILKKETFGYSKVLVVTLASLKEQWKREIERFSGERAEVIAGNPGQRREGYKTDALFKITNYEAVLRDGRILAEFSPDVVVLDEAQRIKNFETKTADSVKAIPRKHSLVLTGTPLENKLEDVYSIVQFLDPNLLAPLWKFAADHFLLSRSKKGRILGYTNLDLLHEKIKPIVIRRRKEEVLSELPDEVVNNYYLELSPEQVEYHSSYAAALMPILNKKYLTPMDIRRMQELLLLMRRVCDSTYLIDRQTNVSPKLKELESILEELVVENKRKTVIFSEWTTMTFLIAKHLSKAGIDYVELSGKVPVKKRQALIDEFTNNPDCKVFLSTDAGGTGLNLQAADCVVNFELPWNPAKLNQRVGRVNRIGQASKCVNVVNLISKDSIEEKIMAGLQMKTDLFKGVFDGGEDTVMFSREKRTELLNKLRAMMGEEPVEFSQGPGPRDEIPEDAPHFLNPKALADDEKTVAYDEEEKPQETGAASTESVAETHETPAAASAMASGGSGNGGAARAGAFQRQSPEKMEKVLDSGMQFLTGLMEMATGQKFESASDDNRMINIDKETGEVTLKFKLPGF